jgi:hypothetical protein
MIVLLETIRILDLVPLLLEIRRLKVDILYEKFKKKNFTNSIRVFCLLRGSKFQNIKELCQIFYLNFKENGKIYIIKLKLLTRYSYFLRYNDPK